MIDGKLEDELTEEERADMKHVTPPKVNGNGQARDFETPDWDRVEPTHHIAAHHYWAESNIEQIRAPMVPELNGKVGSEYATRTGVDRDALIKVSAWNQDDHRFIETLRIWQASVADSGAGKSSLMKPCRTVLDEIEARYPVLPNRSQNQFRIR